MLNINTNIIPIFIFSLPRSGSTVLQKILMSSTQVSSSNEMWILLPLLNLKNKSGYMKFSQKILSNAIIDIEKQLNSRNIKFNNLIKNFILNLYKNLSDKDSKYFVDKTPRYYYIIDEIITLFPTAKFIFLFRNPLEIYSSKLSTNQRNSFKNFHAFYNDLYIAPELLANAAMTYSNISLNISYSSLINSTKETIENLNNYLDLDLLESSIDTINSIKLDGRLGDPNINNYKNQLSVQPFNKWKKIIDTPLRKFILINYLNNLNHNFFNYSNVEKKEIIKLIKSNRIKLNFIFSDIQDLFYLIISFFILKIKKKFENQ